jgi:hypothetical protein
MDQQAKNEIRIFKMFSKLTPYSIDINSIKKEKPPEPDISCNLSDGTKIAFELVGLGGSHLQMSLNIFCNWGCP